MWIEEAREFIGKTKVFLRDSGTAGRVQVKLESLGCNLPGPLEYPYILIREDLEVLPVAVMKVYEEFPYKELSAEAVLSILVETRFKAGDIVRLWDKSKHVVREVAPGYPPRYLLDDSQVTYLDENLEHWSDPVPIRPYDEVLVRRTIHDTWKVAQFSHMTGEPEFPYFADGQRYKECIKFQGNESYLGTKLKYVEPGE